MKPRKILKPSLAEDRRINRGIASDPDTYELTEEEIARMKPLRGRPKSANPKEQVTLRLDSHVVKFFRGRGEGWQTRLNSALKAYVARQQRRA